MNKQEEISIEFIYRIAAEAGQREQCIGMEAVLVMQGHHKLAEQLKAKYTKPNSNFKPSDILPRAERVRNLQGLEVYRTTGHNCKGPHPTMKSAWDQELSIAIKQGQTFMDHCEAEFYTIENHREDVVFDSRVQKEPKE